MIELKEVKKKLGGKEVLKGVNLRVEKGKIFAIIGGSGAGKSVILKHVMGFLRPDSGTVVVDGVAVSTAGGDELYALRKNIGFLFQTAALLRSLTVRNNLALPLQEHDHLAPEEIDRIVTERLNWVRLFNVENKLPSDLSVGMMKRVGLARALVRDPKIILFDEPTTGLDPVLSSTIGHLIVDLHRKLHFTAIAVTHDMHLCYLIADRVAMLYNGQIIETGTPAEIQASRNPLVQQFIHGMPEKE
jgi:phospholipid/cholesterol/gamma-HCH transport system ATP-binding protein